MMTAFRLVLFVVICSHASAQTWNCTNVLDWNFFGAKLTQNNLGGFGPNLDDKHELRYGGVLDDHSGKEVDLVVTAAKGYTPKNPLMNGLWSNGSDQPGKFGQINVLDTTSVSLTFTLVEGGTDTPINIDANEKIIFSVYDFDRAVKRPDEHEYVQFVTPVASHSLPENTTIHIRGHDTDGSLYAESTRGGTALDNPTDPLKMTEIAEESKISVTYVGKSSWQITFGDLLGNPGGGRNILFAGRSQGDCACIGISDWTLHENLKYNNLGGLGPVTSDPPELRYSEVFKTGYEKQPIDLVIKVAEGTTYDPFNTARNGLWPAVADGPKQEKSQMGQINIKSGTHSTFDFIFVKSGTDTPYELSNVLFSVYDLDQNKFGSTLVNHEYVVFPKPVTNWTLTQDPPTQILQSGINNDGTLQFTSTTNGGITDNPTDPLALTPLQKSRSVTVWYSGVSTFQVTFGHEMLGRKISKKKSDGGRNVIFAGPGIYCPRSEEQPNATPTSLVSRLGESDGISSDSSSSDSNTSAVLFVVAFAVVMVAAMAVVAGVWFLKQNRAQDVMVPIVALQGNAYDSISLNDQDDTFSVM